MKKININKEALEFIKNEHLKYCRFVIKKAGYNIKKKATANSYSLKILLIIILMFCNLILINMMVNMILKICILNLERQKVK